MDFDRWMLSKAQLNLILLPCFNCRVAHLKTPYCDFRKSSNSHTIANVHIACKAFKARAFPSRFVIIRRPPRLNRRQRFWRPDAFQRNSDFFSRLLEAGRAAEGFERLNQWSSQFRASYSP